MLQRTHAFRRIALLYLLAVTTPVLAGSPIDPVLQAEHEPAGVVFEIATGKNDSLNWALPQVKTYIEQIRQRYPKLPIAVVTHGREMFALQKSKDGTEVPAQKMTQQLVKDGVALHVCGTYAARKGLSEDDFPEYVNVAAAGPAQINDYIAVGYIRIKITKPE
jgi:intracellular sulfur oxidation DsrE/DsrF family protein